MLREDALLLPWCLPPCPVWDSPAEPRPCAWNTKLPTGTAGTLKASAQHQICFSVVGDPFAGSGVQLVLQEQHFTPSHSPPSTIPSAQSLPCTLQRGRALPGNAFPSAAQTSMDITARNTDHRDCSKPASVQLTPSQGQLFSSSPLSKLSLKPPDFQSQHGTSQKIEIVPRDAAQLC